MKYFIVGGWVRDKLIDKTSEDKDWVVVGGSEQELLKLGFSQVGASFPVFLHPQTHEEYALARKERKTGTGYHGFACEFGPEVTLEEDLKRRDLTINAIAFDPQSQQYIDPFDGQADLKNKILKEVSCAFEEDPLRLLRLARFHSRFFDFTLAHSLIEKCERVVERQELKSLALERVIIEFSKAHKKHYKPKIFWEHCFHWKVFEDLFDLHDLQVKNFQTLVETYEEVLNKLERPAQILAYYCAFFELSFNKTQSAQPKLYTQSLLKHFPIRHQKLVTEYVHTFLLKEKLSVETLLDFIHNHRLMHLQDYSHLAFDFFSLRLSNEDIKEIVLILKDCDKKKILEDKGSQSPKIKLNSYYRQLLNNSPYVDKFSG